MNNIKQWKNEVTQYPRIPTLLGFPKNEDEIYVWCPFCQQFHIHGYTEGEFFQGHRAAHCGDHITVNGNPYTRNEKPTSDSGYFIILATHPDFLKLSRPFIYLWDPPQERREESSHE